MPETKTSKDAGLIRRASEINKERRVIALLGKVNMLTEEYWNVRGQAILDAEMFTVYRGARKQATAYGMGAVLAYLQGLIDGITYDREEA